MKKIIYVIFAVAAFFLLSSCVIDDFKLLKDDNIVIVEQLSTTSEQTEPTEPQTAAAELLEEQSTENENLVEYVLNKRSFKIHYPSCFSVAQMAEKNKEYVRADIEELKERGYSPCYHCYPK